jgi:hypothetical protein
VISSGGATETDSHIEIAIELPADGMEDFREHSSFPVICQGRNFKKIKLFWTLLNIIISTKKSY